MAKEPEMHDLAREDAADENGPEVASPMDSKYHYGMRISPGHEELEKMGMKDAPVPGEAYHVHGRMQVVDSHEDPETGERHATMHFTHMSDAEKIPEGKDGKSVRGEIDDAMAAHDLKQEGKAKEEPSKNTKGEAF